MSLIPVFSVRVKQEVVPGLVTVGRYDRKHASLTCATSGGKVFLHNPFKSSKKSTGDVTFLNINKKITSLCAGSLVDKSADILAVGTPTDLLAYDIDTNTDIFFKELPDGASSILIGRLGSIPSNMIIVGGSCSIFGFDKDGEDKFWTVTGDNVCSMALADVLGEGRNQLLVGSEDFDLRVFRDDAEMVSQTSQEQAVTCLCPLSGNKYAFTLANGAIGVYDSSHLLWKTKSKHQATSIQSFDIDQDGVPEVVAGWSDGRVDIRNAATGDLVAKDQLHAPIAGIVVADYRRDQTPSLVVCSVEGELRGYQGLGAQHAAASPQRSLPSDPKSKASKGGDESPRAESPTEMAQGPQGQSQQQRAAAVVPRVDPAVLQELSQKKQDILLELKHYEKTVKAQQEQAASRKSKSFEPQTSLEVSCALAKIPKAGEKPAGLGVMLRVNASDAVIRGCVLFSETLFEGGSMVVHPAPEALSSEVRFQLFPPKNQAYKVQYQLMVGSMAGSKFAVKEATIEIPPFALFKVESSPPSTSGSVVLKTDKNQRTKVQEFVRDKFLFEEGESASNAMCFTSLQNGGGLEFYVTPDAVTVRTDDVDLAGDILQLLFEHMGVTSSNSIADMPQFFTSMRDSLMRVDEIQSVRQKLSAEMADSSNLIKGLAVRAEDARLIGQVDGMCDAYNQLDALNRDLIRAYNIRCSNHNELVKALKVVNQHIQQAARLRVGKPSSDLMNACRQAIKSNDLQQLFQVVKNGV